MAKSSPGLPGLILLTLSAVNVGAKLNVPRVLLPYSDRQPRFQLSGKENVLIGYNAAAT